MRTATGGLLAGSRVRSGGWASLGRQVGWGCVAVGSFHAAWFWSGWAVLTAGFIFGLAALAAEPGTRRAFYVALGVGMACYAPHLGFFWTLFGPAAVLLWALLAMWPALFAVMLQATERRWGRWVAACALPVIWTGLEYFRAELWPLRFSWLSMGYAFSEAPQVFQWTRAGVYGVGFIVAAGAALAWAGPVRLRLPLLGVGVVLAAGAVRVFPPPVIAAHDPGPGAVIAVGLQLEYPTEDELHQGLEALVTKHAEAMLVVLSEYTLQGPPTPELAEWCRKHNRYLAVGGRDLVSETEFLNTVFVVGPDGEVVFRQAKSVPIQFFQDGLPAPTQVVWESRWGHLGFAVCYDLSYRRVMDRLVQLGAQGLIVPAVDDTTWGAYQHELHARVARVRAAEFGLPVFRVAGSGISQFVDSAGVERASAPFPGHGETIEARLELTGSGRVPWDSVLAPVASGLAGLLGVGLAVMGWRRKAEGRIPDPIAEPPRKDGKSIASPEKQAGWLLP
jgi:apolipoprotein N-acyltransferase